MTRFSIVLLLVLPLAACAGAGIEPLPAIRVESNNWTLKNSAERLLAREKTAAGAAQVLALRESVGESIETVADSGAVNAYKVAYTLHFKFGDGKERSIRRDEIVLHDESRYLAGRRQRSEVVADLRAAALSQMFYILSQTAAGGEKNSDNE